MHGNHGNHGNHIGIRNGVSNGEGNNNGIGNGSRGNSGNQTFAKPPVPGGAVDTVPADFSL